MQAYGALCALAETPLLCRVSKKRAPPKHAGRQSVSDRERSTPAKSSQQGCQLAYVHLDGKVA